MFGDDSWIGNNCNQQSEITGSNWSQKSCKNACKIIGDIIDTRDDIDFTRVDYKNIPILDDKYVSTPLPGLLNPLNPYFSIRLD